MLLHSCCAPCSAAILEWMVANGYTPVILFFNPNIWPKEEYLRRKNEIVRYADEVGVEIVDLDDGWESAHGQWRVVLEHLADEPERGKRCLECFKYRLAVVAEYASENGFDTFTTTLASSRWKSLDQIFEAGRYAESLYPNLTFWNKNWRKGGLYERRNQLAKQFYNQNYCGCEFSVRRVER